jgi:exopolyphosphatase / guanosine-5'-triphosphate,3'-diphosphate pyrophosphatase
MTDNAAIVPRWEWRAFDRRFAAAEDRFDVLDSTGVQESEELYLLSGAARTNVKVRDGLLDVKVREEVDSSGLERWNPVMKTGFPLKDADVAHVLEALETPVPNLDRETYTLDQFLGELAEPRGIRPVTVSKRRVRYVVGGCTAEVTDVIADGQSVRTIAIESEDPAAVVDAVRAMGLDGYANTNYARGLTAVVDGEPARYAVIDVGTNSVKFHLAERSAGGGWRTLVDRADVTRLGEDLEASGVIVPAALQRTTDAIAGMAEEARGYGVRAIAAVGTAGLRIAANSGAVVDEIRSRSGVSIEVISGEEESRLAYLAVQAGLGLGDGLVVVFDTGGGSSQFTFGRGSQVDERFSVDVGAVRYTERFGLDRMVSSEVLRDALAAIARDLAAIDGRPAPEALVAMGGAITNMTAVKHGLATYDPDVVHGTILDRREVDRQIDLYRSRDADDRRSIVGLQPKRAEVILAGACIVRTVMEKLGRDSATVSDRGLRHGVMAERFGP